MMAGLRFPRASWLAALVLCAAMPAQQPAGSPPGRVKEKLSYGVEWRLIRAGTVSLDWTPVHTQPRLEYQADVKLESAGLVNRLYRVQNSYTAQGGGDFCMSNSFLSSQERDRRRETRVTVASGKANYLEKDLNRNAIVNQKQIDVPGCVSDLISGLYRLRASMPAVGQSGQFPITDGKKSVSMKVDAEAREEVKTPAGTFKTVRCEIHLFNDVLFARKGSLTVWLTDDARHMPVQFRIKLQFYIGTIMVQLEKEEHA